MSSVVQSDGRGMAFRTIWRLQVVAYRAVLRSPTCLSGKQGCARLATCVVGWGAGGKTHVSLAVRFLLAYPGPPFHFHGEAGMTVTFMLEPRQL